MNSFTRILSTGDLRSDGFANEVARIVSEHPAHLPDLMEALVSADPSVRGHAADALEKVSRSCPSEVAVFLPSIIRLARNDNVAMVRWHLAMVLGHLSIVSQTVSEAKRTLLALLTDGSPFVRSWAITSLCIIAKNSPGHADSIIHRIAPLSSDSSAAVAKRAHTDLRVLSNPESPLPKTWVKSPHIRNP
jgi:HEAT repeat protein